MPNSLLGVQVMDHVSAIVCSLLPSLLCNASIVESQCCEMYYSGHPSCASLGHYYISISKAYLFFDSILLGK